MGEYLELSTCVSLLFVEFQLVINQRSALGARLPLDSGRRPLALTAVDGGRAARRRPGARRSADA